MLSLDVIIFVWLNLKIELKTSCESAQNLKMLMSWLILDLVCCVKRCVIPDVGLSFGLSVDHLKDVKTFVGVKNLV